MLKTSTTNNTQNVLTDEKILDLVLSPKIIVVLLKLIIILLQIQEIQFVTCCNLKYIIPSVNI